MSTTADFRALTDLARAAAETERRISAVGLTRADIDLFAASWGRAIVACASASQRPVSAVFFLCREALGAPLSDSAVASRVSEVRANQPSFTVLHVSSCGSAMATESIGAADRARYPGGRWTHAQASELSLITDSAAVIWVSGYEFKVFAHGHLALSLSDVSNMRTEHANELSRRVPLNSEFFDLLAKHLLQHSSETGIWFLPEHKVLVPRPETHIEERTVWFMTGYLSGYSRHTRQMVDESNGRIDVAVTFSDGVTQIIELKWIGRSLKQTHAQKAASTIAKAARTKWACTHVTVLDERTIKAGVVQLGIYLQNPAYDGGFLVVIDCRDQQTDLNVSAKELAAANIASWQFALADVKLDPRPPSAIARASLRTAA